MLKLDERWVAIGFFAASVAGCTLTVANSFHAWSVYQKCSLIEIPLYGASRDCQTLTLKAKEIPPEGYQLIDQKRGYPDIKLVGLAVAIVAGIVSYSWNDRLSEILELAEKQKALEQASDSRLLEKGIDLHTQLQERRLTLEIGEKAKEFERLFGVPNFPALEDDRKQEEYLNAEFTPKEANHSLESSNPNADMLYGWLLTRNLAEGDVREICRSSIEGHKLTAEQVRGFLNELAVQNLIEWLNDQKTKFRLITGE